jgi:hypothetical protein
MNWELFFGGIVFLVAEMRKWNIFSEPRKFNSWIIIVTFSIIGIVLIIKSIPS